MKNGSGLGATELRGRLLEFDRAVQLLYPGRRFRFVFVGGGAMILLGCLARATSDLDVLDYPQELVHLMEQYDLSGRVTAYLDHFAYGLEDRLVPLDLETVCLECYAASLEDVVVAKLHSGRPTDEADVRRPEVLAALDWSRLAEVVADTAGSMMSERRHREFLCSYSRYLEEYGPCGD